MATSDEFDKTVNESGFPLQVGIRHLIEQSVGIGWKVAASEFPWHDDLTEDEKFVDLVLSSQDQTTTLVVECKRARQTEWIFLREQGKKSRRKMSGLVTIVRDGETEPWGWESIAATPESPLSEFCIVRKSGQKSQELIEATAAQVMRAADAISGIELNYLRSQEGTFCRLYFPAIVTTARLFICDYSMADFSIASGEFGKSEYSEVPMVRFHKPFSSGNLDAWNKPLAEATDLAGTTVLIINAAHLLATLADWEVGESVKEILARPPIVHPESTWEDDE